MKIWELWPKTVWPFTSLEWPGENLSLLYQYNIKYRIDENKEKYQLGDYLLIQYQILEIYFMKIV